MPGATAAEHGGDIARAGAGGTRTDMAVAAAAEAMPYIVMTLKLASTAGLMAILRAVLRGGAGGEVSAVVLVSYQLLAASVTLFLLAAVLDRGKRRKPSTEILCLAFVTSFLQLPLGEVLLMASLEYVTATFQSVALNAAPAAVFVAAVVCRREPFGFLDTNSQAKLWGVAISAAGATVMVVLNAARPANEAAHGGGGFLLGALMVGVALVAGATSSLMLETVAIKYSADLTLSAMMNAFGTIQTFVIAAFMERDPSSWRIRMDGSQLLAILYGGILVNGLLYLGVTWCTHKKGPVFVSAFAPTLVFFSFLIETFILGTNPQLGSIMGAILVIGGLYLLLRAKSREEKESVEGSCVVDPLLTP